jgi:hypothetical protein
MDLQHVIATPATLPELRLMFQNSVPTRCTGKAFADQSALYTTSTPATLGPLVTKSLYRAFTDESFKTPLPHDPALGILGPLIQAQVRASDHTLALHTVQTRQTPLQGCRVCLECIQLLLLGALLTACHELVAVVPSMHADFKF